jgi:cytochrome c-type biogenesis protein CcmH
MPQPRYYLALGKAQAGDVAGALKDWRALAAASPPDAGYLPALKAQIARAEAATATPTPAPK